MTTDHDCIWLLASHVAPETGLERMTLALARALASSGADVRVVAIGEDPGAAERHRVARLGPRVRKLGRVASIWRIRKWVQNSQPRLVVACGVWAALPLLIGAAGRPIVVVAWEHSLSRDNVRRSLPLRVLGWAARALYPQAHAVVAVSDYLADCLISAGHRNVKCIPNLIPGCQEDLAPPLPDTSLAGEIRTLLSVGRLVRVKNHELVIRALAELPPTFVLRIAGDGPRRARLMVLAERLGVASRVKFLGHVEDMSTEYSRCRVVVQPSLGETFGLSLFEAAQHRRPVVALDRGIMVDFIPKFVPGMLCKATPLDIASAITAIATTPPPATAYDVAHQAREREFSEELITERWLTLFAELKVIGEREV